MDEPVVPDIAALLAPTWKARARAEDALLGLMMSTVETCEPWPEPVQRALRALLPTPAEFLSALVGFWADLSARRHAAQMRGFGEQPAWQWPGLGDHVNRFPMTPADPAISGLSMRGVWVWKFVERLGPMAGLVERELIACLDHPDPCVRDSAENALGNADALSDDAFRRFLAVADSRGQNGMLRKRAFALARHTDRARVSIVLDGLTPSSPTDAHVARFAILGALQGDAASEAFPVLVGWMSAAWPDAAHGVLLDAVDALCSTLDANPDELMEQIRARAAHTNVEVRSSAARFIARHATEAEGSVLTALASDPHPWVRSGVCVGLMSRREVDATLLRVLCQNSLGNYDGYDGEPHDIVVDLLLHDPAAAAQVMPEIVRWWDETTATACIERDSTRQAMQLCKAVSPYVDTRPMLSGLERALAYLDEGPATVELPDLNLPGAVPIVRNAIEADMLAAGTAPEIAAPMADLHGAVLAELAAQVDNLQAEIDAEQAIFDAEMLDLYPERAAESVVDAKEADEDAEDGQYEDEFIVELRAVVADMRSPDVNSDSDAHTGTGDIRS